MPDATAYTPNKQALFVMPADVTKSAHQQLAALSALAQKDLLEALNEHGTQIYSYDGRMAATLKVPGFSDNSADASSQCLIYDQAHYVTKQLDDYEYQFGWTQRLVIKVTKWDAKVSLTVPSAVAAGCDMGTSSAAVTYIVKGLAGPYKDLTGEAAQFGVDQFAQYRIKMQALFDDLDNSKMKVVPVIIARVRTQDAVQTNVRDLYRGYAYRLCGVAGILRNHTADEWFSYITTKGKDSSGAPQPIADETYFRQCVDAVYSDYGIKPGGKLSVDRTRPEQDELKNRIIGDMDGFAIQRAAFQAT